MDIGGVKIEGKVVLGPMAGITTLAYRRFYRPFGVALSVSEMISDAGLAYGNDRTFDYLSTTKDDRPVALQLFGSDLSISKKAVAIMEEKGDYDILDLNFGCPVHKVTKTGAGSAFLADPEKLYEYAKGIVEVSHKPVTAKIRLGIDEKHVNVFEVADLLQKAGVKVLCVHSRTKAAMYSGTADHEAIRGLGKKLDIPLIVSGDIFSVDDAIRAMDITGASLVMVARGAVGHPLLVTNINNHFEGKPLVEETPMGQLGYACGFADMLIEEIGERRAIMQLRGILPHFFKGFPGFKRIRNDISTSIYSKDDLDALLRGVEMSFSRL